MTVEETGFARHVLFNLWGCQRVPDARGLTEVVGEAVRLTGAFITATTFEEMSDGGVIVGVFHTLGHATLCVTGTEAYADFFSFNPRGWQEFGRALKRLMGPARTEEKQLDRPRPWDVARGVRQSSCAFGQYYMNRNGGLAT